MNSAHGLSRLEDDLFQEILMSGSSLDVAGSPHRREDDGEGFTDENREECHRAREQIRIWNEPKFWFQSLLIQKNKLVQDDHSPGTTNLQIVM